VAEAAPLKLTTSDALRIIRSIASDTGNVLLTQHAIQRARQRRINRRQIDLCLRKGTIGEGPFRNERGNWQVTLRRHAAEEEIECTVVIEWKTRLIVVTVY
jgi:hypothetical protein